MAKDARLRRAVDRLKSKVETATWPAPAGPAPAGPSPAGGVDAERHREPSTARLAEIETRLRRQEQSLHRIAEDLREPPPATLAGAEVERIARAVAFVQPAPRAGVGVVGVVVLVLLAGLGGTAFGAWQSELMRSWWADATSRVATWSPPW
jgi:hypothetical protein